MADREDYYNLLGVERNATPDEIKKAYRKKARECHPDVNQSDPRAEERFKQVGEAYNVLSDPQKRAMYDRYGHDMPRNSGFNSSTMNGGSYGFDFSDIFDGFFGGGASSARRVDLNGDNLRYDLTVSLQQAYDGAKVKINLVHYAACDICDGTGSATKSSPVTCPTCGGSGQVKKVGTSVFGMQIMSTMPCESCNGSGQSIKDPCTNCYGQGRKRINEELEVEVPPGVDNGSRIRYTGKGDAGVRGANSGDLVIFMNIKPHKSYERHGADIYRVIDVPFSIMALGGKIEIDHLSGENVEVDIPANTVNGYDLKLKGSGMPELRSSHFGDLYLITNVSVPKDLSKRERELLTAFAKERGEQVNDASFLRKVKDLLE